MKPILTLLILLISLGASAAPPSLGDIIKRLYPTAIRGTDYLVNSTEILHWNAGKLGPQPTQQQKDAMRDTIVAERQVEAAAELNRRTQVANAIAALKAGSLTNNQQDQVLLRLLQSLYHDNGKPRVPSTQ